jgi:hypothetical protein
MRPIYPNGLNAANSDGEKLAIMEGGLQFKLF